MKKDAAFTLVELLITLAILGILAAIAYPSYEVYVVKSKRSDAMAALLNAAQAMERYKSNRFTYVVAGGLGSIYATQVPVSGGAVYYTLSLDSTAATYTLTATPTGSMAGKDGALTITHTGAKTWTGKGGAAHACWPNRSDCN